MPGEGLCQRAIVGTAAGRARTLDGEHCLSGHGDHEAMGRPPPPGRRLDDHIDEPGLSQSGHVIAHRVGVDIERFGQFLDGRATRTGADGTEDQATRPGRHLVAPRRGNGAQTGGMWVRFCHTAYCNK